MVYPYPQEAEIAVAWEPSTTSSAPYSVWVFSPCAFLLCPNTVGSTDDKCICIDVCILMDMFVVSPSLQHLCNSFTAEACHRNWSLMRTIKQLCCRLDATLYMQRKAVCFFFFPCIWKCILQMKIYIFLVCAESWLWLFEWWLGKNWGCLLIDRNNLAQFPVLHFHSCFFVWLGTDPERYSKKCCNSAFSNEI